MPERPGPRGPFPPLSAEVRAASLARTLAEAPEPRRLWVFAYGSLIWSPGFEPAHTARARLQGYHRSFCMWTVHARGRPEQPGLGLALAPGGCCEGLALAIPPERRETTLTALWEREMYTGIYRPEWVRVECAGESRPALAFVVDPGHPQYAAGLPLARQAALIASAEGEKGSCYEYLRSTVDALGKHRIRDPGLDELMLSTERARRQPTRRQPTRRQPTRRQPTRRQPTRRQPTRRQPKETL